jgi:hypothetical protein
VAGWWNWRPSEKFNAENSLHLMIPRPSIALDLGVTAPTRSDSTLVFQPGIFMAKPKQVKSKVTFSFNSPSAQQVTLAGDFTGWEQAPLPMKKSKSGVWSKTLSLSPGEYQYRLLVDGHWKDDPECPHRRPNQYGGENCVCIVQDSALSPQAA